MPEKAAVPEKWHTGRGNFGPVAGLLAGRLVCKGFMEYIYSDYWDFFICELLLLAITLFRGLKLVKWPLQDNLIYIMHSSNPGAGIAQKAPTS
jgi:hypothetical protein